MRNLRDGLGLVPEGRHTKGCRGRGFVNEVSSIPRLEEYVKYANGHRVSLMFISMDRGLKHIDDVVEPSRCTLYDLDAESRRLWCEIVAEQAYRTCMSLSVSDVHLLVERAGLWSLLVRALERRGLTVRLPFLRKQSPGLPWTHQWDTEDTKDENLEGGTQGRTKGNTRPLERA